MTTRWRARTGTLSAMSAEKRTWPSKVPCRCGTASPRREGAYPPRSPHADQGERDEKKRAVVLPHSDHTQVEYHHIQTTLRWSVAATFRSVVPNDISAVSHGGVGSRIPKTERAKLLSVMDTTAWRNPEMTSVEQDGPSPRQLNRTLCPSSPMSSVGQRTVCLEMSQVGLPRPSRRMSTMVKLHSAHFATALHRHNGLWRRSWRRRSSRLRRRRRTPTIAREKSEA